MVEILKREFIYLWYYFEIQLRQIAGYWILGMVLGSLKLFLMRYCRRTLYMVLFQKEKVF
jgi:hypothetical protein